MAKIKKKGTSGQAANYITRTQAVRKLQISLPDFRRLCIFKGIYPREPRNKKKASKASTTSTTFYYARDIQYLLHEPLIDTFRKHKTLQKKVSRLLGRGEVGEAARIEKALKPKISLDHVIKERYPTFIDALRDLDDALNMLFLFANLPSSPEISPKSIEVCQRLCHEFEHYIITTHSLKKSFLSIKGIYYQAEIQGQDIFWVVPYKFVQKVTGDVDFRIMATFVEFYTTLLGFVNFRLYTTIGLIYPPKFDKVSDENGGELRAFTLEGQTNLLKLNGAPVSNDHAIMDEDAREENQAKVEKALAKVQGSEESQDVVMAQVDVTQDGASEEFDKFEVAAPGGDVLPEPQISNTEAGSLFEPLTFYLSRETPRHPLEFLLRSFGCKRIGWDAVVGDGAFTSDESDSRITHQIVDRPGQNPAQASAAKDAGSNGRIPGRTYVQPQWVWDCINAGKLLRPDLYSPGTTLPPHLSPFVQPTKGAYDPTIPLAEQETEEEIQEAAAKAAEKAGGAESEEQDDASDSEEEEEEEEKQEEQFEGFDDEETTAQLRHQAELEAEASGKPLESLLKSEGSRKADEIRKRAAKKRKEREDELQRKMMMASNKKKRLYEMMQYGNKKKEEEAKKIRGKRRKLEKST